MNSKINLPSTKPNHRTYSYIKVIFKSLMEFIPIYLFLLSFEIFKNFFISTFILILSTIAFTLYIFKKEKRLPLIALFVSFETTFFGSLTLLLKNPAYVQMRDTFYDVCLGLVILFSGAIRKPIIRQFFGHIFDLSLETWVRLSYFWAVILALFGSGNEYFRRNFDEVVWTQYKLLVIVIGVSVGLILLYRYRRNIREEVF